MGSDLGQQIDAAARELVSGRRVIVLCTVLAGATSTVARLQAYGATRIRVIGLVDGTGPVPSGPGITSLRLDLGPMGSIADELALTARLINDAPSGARDAVRSFDPEGRALVYVNGFTGRHGPFLGRDTIGGRPPEFERLEDKTLSSGVWAAAGVPHCPEDVVPCDWEVLRARAAGLDQGHGTVWSADASEGMNGGADRVFRVGSDGAAREAYASLAACSRRVRIMPFLDGVPCSIHGVVLPDGVAVLRPVELIVLRRPSATRFVYAGLSTGWDPPATYREQMREVARRVGAHLASEHGYRGGFGVDGVLTAAGFRPTELNPRFTGGLQTIAKGVPDLPIRWLHDLLLLRHPLGAAARQVERTLLEAAEQSRFGAAYTNAPRRTTAGTETVLVTGDQDGLRTTTNESRAVGTLERGPGTHGDLVRFTPGEVSPGTRMAPWGVAAFALADRLWDTGFGPLQAAPEVPCVVK